MKKIAVLCNYELLESRVGGMDYFFWNFDKVCKEKGYQVVWFFPNKTNYGKYQDFNIVSSNGDSIESSFINYCKRENIHFQFVICHFLELCTSFYKQVKQQLPKSQIISVDHNPRPLNGYTFKKKLVKKIKGFLFSKYIDVFVTVSEHTKSSLMKDFGNNLQVKTKVIYNGILFDNYVLRDKKITNFPKFIIASHLRKEKGIQDIIHAVALLPHEIKEKIIIDVFGNGPFEKELKQLVNELSIENNFDFKGSVANLFEIYANYDYLLHASYGETFCFSVVESLACNVPVICTHSPGGNVLNLVKNKENGYLFDCHDIQSITDILKDVCSNNIKIDHIDGTNIRNSFSLDNMVKQYVYLLD